MPSSVNPFPAGIHDTSGWGEHPIYFLKLTVRLLNHTQLPGLIRERNSNENTSVQKETTKSYYFDNGAGSVGCLPGNHRDVCASVFAARHLCLVAGCSE